MHTRTHKQTQTKRPLSQPLACISRSMLLRYKISRLELLLHTNSAWPFLRSLLLRILPRSQGAAAERPGGDRCSHAGHFRDVRRRSLLPRRPPPLPEPFRLGEGSSAETPLAVHGWLQAVLHVHVVRRSAVDECCCRRCRRFLSVPVPAGLLRRSSDWGHHKALRPYRFISGGKGEPVGCAGEGCGGGIARWP